jgi:hypothetical protein
VRRLFRRSGEMRGYVIFLFSIFFVIELELTPNKMPKDRMTIPMTN